MTECENCGREECPTLSKEAVSGFVPEGQQGISSHLLSLNNFYLTAKLDCERAAHARTRAQLAAMQEVVKAAREFQHGFDLASRVIIREAAETGPDFAAVEGAVKAQRNNAAALFAALAKVPDAT